VDKHADSRRKAPINKRKGNDFGQGTFWNRPTNPKRTNTSEPKALALHGENPQPHDLIVDTGASHVLFQQRHMDLLRHVEISQPNCKPFAILRAANGQILKAIGRGIFRIKQIAVVAYIFKNEDLVHNLLGIAPFADCGCEAVFTTDFNLYHNQDLLLTGKRHSANLWHISLPSTLRTSDPPIPHLQGNNAHVLLLHEDTRANAKYVQFVHACFGSPPPTTFLRDVEKGYLSGENQFPRLSAKLVRRHMPDSEATAKGHLDKTATKQPHALSQAVSARRRAHLHAARQIKPEHKNRKTPLLPPFDPTKVPRSTTLHLHYTGRLPRRGSSGTLYFLVA
jgi:hypothetical protein